MQSAPGSGSAQSAARHPVQDSSRECASRRGGYTTIENQALTQAADRQPYPSGAEKVSFHSTEPGTDSTSPKREQEPGLLPALLAGVSRVVFRLPSLYFAAFQQCFSYNFWRPVVPVVMRRCAIIRSASELHAHD